MSLSRAPHLQSALRRKARVVAPMIFLGALLVGQVGCGMRTSISTRVSFEELCGLTHEQFAAMGEATLVRWIQDTYGVSPEQGGEVWHGEPVVSYRWVRDGDERVANFRAGRLIRILVFRTESGPTFGQVVATLGPPKVVSRYVTRIDATVYEVALEYPMLGLTVGHRDRERGTVTQIQLSKRMRVNTLICYRAGSLEEVLQEAFPVAHENIPAVLDRKLPWPGFGSVVPLDSGPLQRRVFGPSG